MLHNFTDLNIKRTIFFQMFGILMLVKPFI